MIQAAQKPTVSLGKDFITRTNKPEQTQGVKGAQLKAVTHYTSQGNPALFTLRLVQANFAKTTSLFRFKAQNVLFPSTSWQAQASLVEKKKKSLFLYQARHLPPTPQINPQTSVIRDQTIRDARARTGHAKTAEPFANPGGRTPAPARAVQQQQGA